MYPLKRLFHPELFQGMHKKTDYFEGWYYKLIDQPALHTFAVIPGISNGSGNRHAFIQILNARDCGVYYQRYNIEEFKARKDRFEIQIGNNYFSASEIRLDISSEEVFMKGHLLFRDIVPYPKTLYSPGIMGPFSYVPFMECHHGIINVHHTITGALSWKGSPIGFNGGCGYIEKDWGTSFPEAWIWAQSNHFDCADATFLFSMAKIPWLGRSFTGLLCFLRVEHSFHIFATYTGARVTCVEDTGDTLFIVVEDKRHRMEIKALRTAGGVLKAPRKGLMTGEISESLGAEIEVALVRKDGGTVFSGKGKHAGLEISKEKVFCKESSSQSGKH